MVIAPVYVVGVAVTQNSCAPLMFDGQSVSDVQPDGLQTPEEQMLEGGPQLLSLSHVIWQAPAVHSARGLLSDWMQSAFAMQPAGLQRCVVVSHVSPATQSRSRAHLK